MIPDYISSFTLSDLVGAAFRFQLFSLLIAGVVTAGVLFTPVLRVSGEEPAPSVATRYEKEYRALGIGVIAFIGIFAAENLITGYVLKLSDVVSWWRYATPLIAATLCLAVCVAVIWLRGTAAPQQPAAATARRSWTSFGSRAGFIGAGIAVLALIATTVAAGLASTPDEYGRYIYIEIHAPNASIEPLRPWFYGWAYGVPVLICLAMLLVAAWVALRANSVRPFIRPLTVVAEQRSRRAIASTILSIVTAGALLALGGAFRFIRAGAMSQVTVQDSDGAEESYELVWQYAEFARAAGWLAPIIEIVAFVLLLLVAVRLLFPGALLPASGRSERPQPETAR